MPPGLHGVALCKGVLWAQKWYLPCPQIQMLQGCPLCGLCALSYCGWAVSCRCPVSELALSAAGSEALLQLLQGAGGAHPISSQLQDRSCFGLYQPRLKPSSMCGGAGAI